MGLLPSNSICCEVNFPIEGKSVQIAGVLARDETGTVWILHRGRFRGIGRALFEKHYKGKWQNAEGDPYAVVAALGQPNLVRHVADFVRLVHGIKKPSP
jgi:hypothetical protein